MAGVIFPPPMLRQRLEMIIFFVEFELVLTHAGNVYRQRSRVALRNQP